MTLVPKKKAAKAAALSSTVGANLEPMSLIGMLVFVDALAHVICFLVKLALILLGQVAVILGHVLLLVVLKALLAPLKPSGLSRRQFIVLDAVGDPVLLVLFALINLVDARMTGINLAGSRA